MLKKSPFSPAQPRRAKTRLFPSSVLGSSKSSTYPTRRTSCPGSLGWAGEKWYASGFDSPAALLDGLLSILRLFRSQHRMEDSARIWCINRVFQQAAKRLACLDVIFPHVLHETCLVQMNVHDADTNLRNQLQWPVFLHHRHATHLTRPPHEAQGSAGVRPRACLGAKRAGRNLRGL